MFPAQYTFNVQRIIPSISSFILSTSRMLWYGSNAVIVSTSNYGEDRFLEGVAGEHRKH